MVFFQDPPDEFENRITINQSPLVRVHECTYLGLDISDVLSWTTYLDKLSSNLRKSIAKVFRVRDLLPMEWRRCLYFAFGNSYISTYLVFWGGSSRENIQRIQNLQSSMVRVCFSVTRRQHMAMGSELLYSNLKIYYINQMYVHRMALWLRDRPSYRPTLLEGRRAVRGLHYNVPISRYRTSDQSVRVAGPRLLNAIKITFPLISRYLFIISIQKQIRDAKFLNIRNPPLRHLP
jgi:hypothetical protein